MNEMTKVSSEDTLANAVGDTTVACTFTKTDAPVTRPKSSFTVPEMLS